MFLAEWSKTPVPGRPHIHVFSNRCSSLEQGWVKMAADGQTIAVVDDDPSVRKALARLLSVFGYRVELFASAEEFLDAARASKAMCLLVDIKLGAMSGLDLARKLSLEGFEFPIVFMTGSAKNVVRLQCLDFGCVAFLEKPILEARLMDALAKATGANLPRA
jgi:FixJ family two-component response regulator